MTLTVTGIETIELTDPLDLCQKPVIPTPMPSGPWVTPTIPNIGDVNPIPLPRRPWDTKWEHKMGKTILHAPDYKEKWGRGLTAAVTAKHHSKGQA